jgi:hypothetical protein
MAEKRPNIDTHPVHGRRDDALNYLDEHANVQDEATVDLAALRRKIDFRIIPFMFCCYVLQFLDKVMLNVRHSLLFAQRFFFSLMILAVCCCDGDKERPQVGWQ